jgi:hypothetical protein
VVPLAQDLRIFRWPSAAEVWQVAFLDEAKHLDPACIQDEGNFGALWNGENEALNRLILGLGFIPRVGLEALGMTGDQIGLARDAVIPHLYENLILPAAPVQDAIDLSRFMVETTKGFIRFSIRRAKTVVGPVEIAAITKHEGFKWVQRKHFYPHDLNAG